jgi:hypothetical protein
MGSIKIMTYYMDCIQQASGLVEHGDKFGGFIQVGNI